MGVRVGFVVDKVALGLGFLPVHTIIQRINRRKETVETISLLRIEGSFQAEIGNVLKQELCHVSRNMSGGRRCA
jgi:hypothetical protein